MIRLERIHEGNIREILELQVGDSQKNFVAPNDISIIEAYIAISHDGHAFPFGIYEDDTPVGFCMIGFDTDDGREDAPAIAKGNYNLWRFMIDERHQGKGYGKAAMKRIMDYIGSQPCGPAEYCWLSYEPENTAAKTLYASFGFQETGEYDGDEAIAILKLQPRISRQTSDGQTGATREPTGEAKRAAPGEEKAAARLACELWPGHTPEEMTGEYEQLLSDDDAAVFLYREGGEAAGFAQCQLRHDYVEGTETSPVGYLEGIYVRETGRRRGIARKLLNACEEWAKAKGCTEFASDCELTNTESQAFHQAAGFREANRIVAYVKKI